MRSLKATLLPCFLLLLLDACPSEAQDIHYLQIDATPLAINPAFTGAFDGGLRASAIYWNHWASETLPFTTFAVSVDMPVFITKQGDYFAAGAQFIQDRAGDGNLTNFSGVASFAYHKLFKAFTNDSKKNTDLSFGIQGGYAQSEIYLASLYFGNRYYSPYAPGNSIQYQLGLGNAVNTGMVNAGINFAQSLAPRFNYTIGIAGYNLNHPAGPAESNQYDAVGFDTRYDATIGANWQIFNRLTLRPAAWYQVRQHGNDFIAGNEFYFSLYKKHKSGRYGVSIFAGAWYNTGEALSLTAGADAGSFRVGMAYNFANTNSGGDGGLGITARYILPHKLISSHNTIVPCNRF